MTQTFQNTPGREVQRWNGDAVFEVGTSAIPLNVNNGASGTYTYVLKTSAETAARAVLSSK